MSLKKRILLFIVLLLITATSFGMYVMKSDKAQLSLQVEATNHIKTLLPLLPKEFIDQKMILEHSDLIETVLKHSDLKVLRHTKKTNNTGIATIEIKVPYIAKQTINALLISTNEEVIQQMNQVSDPADIDVYWLMKAVGHELKGIDFKEAKQETLTIEVSTYATKDNVWSFSKDAIEDASIQIIKGMGFDEKWQADLFKAIP